MRSLTTAFLLMSLTAVAEPTFTLRTESQDPMKQGTIPASQLADLSLKVYSYTDGEKNALTTNDAAVFGYGTNWDFSASMVLVNGTANTNDSYFAVNLTPSDVPASGSYFYQVMQTNAVSGKVFVLGRGIMTVERSPITGGPGTLNLQTIVNWDQVYNLNSGPWVLTNSASWLEVVAHTNSATAHASLFALYVTQAMTNGWTVSAHLDWLVRSETNGWVVSSHDTFVTNNQTSVTFGTVNTPIVKATTSAGGALKSLSDASCLTWGAGGGCNVTTADGLTVNGVISGNGSGITNLTGYVTTAQTNGWVVSSHSAFLTAETDPIWSSEKSGYATTESLAGVVTNNTPSAIIGNFTLTNSIIPTTGDMKIAKASGFGIIIGAGTVAEDGIVISRSGGNGQYGSISIGGASLALGSYSLSLGDSTRADGVRAVAMGYETRSYSDSSLALGFNATANGVKAQVYGYGYDESNKLNNNEAGSIAFGANSTIPSFRLHAASGVGTIGDASFYGTVNASNLTVTGISKIILPTSTNGLTSGMLWNDGGTIKVTP